jgi:O-antigen/teichoic acid export membrane protein
VSRISRTIAWTLVSEATSVVATAWITRRFAQVYAEREVDAYFVVRQVLGWVLNVGFFGLNVSLPRALACASGSAAAQRRQVAGAFLLMTPLFATILLVALFVPSGAARLFLYDAGQAPLFVAVSLLFCANALFAVCAAALQGLDRFVLLAGARVMAWGVAPPLVVATLGGRASLPTVLLVWSGAIALIDVWMIVLAARVLASGLVIAERLEPVLAVARRLFRFGGLRMVGAIAQVSSVALAPTLVLWSGADARTAAAFSVAAMFTMLLSPVRLALQPVALTELARMRESDEARRLAVDYCAVAACLTAAATAALGMSGDRVVSLWLGERYAATPLVLRCSVIVIGLHFFCYTLEGVLDPLDDQNRRPRAQLVAAGLFCLGVAAACGLHAGWPGVFLAQLAAVLLQTALYLRMLAARYGLPESRELIHGALTVGGGCTLIGFFARGAGTGSGPTAFLVASEAAAAVVLVMMARRAGVRWLGLLLGGFGRSR